MPYDKLSDAPASLRGIKPAITLAQANSIARCADALEDEGKVESPWAVCVASFKKAHVVKDGAWVKREEGKAMGAVEIDGVEVRLEELVAVYKAISAGPDELSRLVRDAWRAKFQRDTTPVPVMAGGWVKEVCEDTVIIEVDDGLLSYPYTVTDDDIEFGEPVKVEVEYRPVSGKALTGDLPLSNALKAISIEGNEMRVGNYIALFGTHDLSGILGISPHKAGEFFTAQTDFESDYTKTGTLHVDFDHGLGMTGTGSDLPAPGRDDILGRVDWSTAKADSRGLWVERVLNRRNVYMQFLEELIKARMIGTSSECVPRGVKKASDGRIEAWPLKRDTLTVSPMEWRMMTQNPLVAKAIGGLLNGLNLPQLDEGGESAGADCQKAEAEKMKTRIEILLAQTKLLEV